MSRLEQSSWRVLLWQQGSSVNNPYSFYSLTTWKKTHGCENKYTIYFAWVVLGFIVCSKRTLSFQNLRGNQMFFLEQKGIWHSAFITHLLRLERFQRDLYLPSINTVIGQNRSGRFISQKFFLMLHFPPVCFIVVLFCWEITN